MYRTCLIPNIDYCAMVWNRNRKNLIVKFDKMQRKVISIPIRNPFYYQPNYISYPRCLAMTEKMSVENRLNYLPMSQLVKIFKYEIVASSTLALIMSFYNIWLILVPERKITRNSYIFQRFQRVLLRISPVGSMIRSPQME